MPGRGCDLQRRKLICVYSKRKQSILRQALNRKASLFHTSQAYLRNIKIFRIFAS